MVFPFLIRKREHHHWIAHILISLGTKFQLKLTILVFWTKICPKRVFLVKNRKSKHQHWIVNIRISQTDNSDFLDQICPKKGIFGAKWKKWTPPLNSPYSNQYRYQISTLTILIFLSKFIQKGYFWSKTENITTEFCIFELVWVPNFSLDHNFHFLGQICPKRVLPV